MKNLNFTVKLIRQALMDGTKTQTIRLAKTPTPRFKVGDWVRIVWNIRGKDQKFIRDVEITEVIKAEMGAGIFCSYYAISEQSMKENPGDPRMDDEDLARRDGFKNASEMFKLLYRWKGRL